MATRKIKYGSIADSGATGGEIFSSATTFGELKEQEATIGVLSAGMSALAKPEGGGANVKLTSDSQSLPEGGFTLWFVLDKNASGNDNN